MKGGNRSGLTQSDRRRGPHWHNWIYYGISTGRERQLNESGPENTHPPIDLPPLTHTHIYTEGESRRKLCCNSIIIGLNRNYLPQWATKRHTTRQRTQDRRIENTEKEGERHRQAGLLQKGHGRTHIATEIVQCPRGIFFATFATAKSVDCLWFCLSACLAEWLVSEWGPKIALLNFIA